jgi:hypothetical protein
VSEGYRFSGDLWVTSTEEDVVAEFAPKDAEAAAHVTSADDADFE